jgi:hypothetical protein
LALGGSDVRGASSGDGAIVGEAEQLDRAFDIVRLADRERDPSRVRQDVMWSGATGRDQFVPDPARKRKIGDPVAVQMPELTAADPKLDTTESMRSDLDGRPRSHDRGDALSYS